MNQSITNAVLGFATAILALIVAALVAYVLVANDRREELHDQVIANQQSVTDWERAYGKLLERVGGADVPNVPLRVPPKPGNQTGVK